jgi:uncharacterized membrane protein
METKWPKFARFRKKKVFRFPDSYDELDYVDKNIDKFVFFLLSYLVCSQIWLNHLRSIVTSKLEKKTLPVSSRWKLILSLDALANWCNFFFSARFKYVCHICLCLHMFKSQFNSISKKKDYQGQDYKGRLFYYQSSFNMGNSHCIYR